MLYIYLIPETGYLMFFYQCIQTGPGQAGYSAGFFHVAFSDQNKVPQIFLFRVFTKIPQSGEQVERHIVFHRTAPGRGCSDHRIPRKFDSQIDRQVIGKQCGLPFPERPNREHIVLHIHQLLLGA